MEQWIAVEDKRAHRTDNHQVEAESVQAARFAGQPEECGNTGQQAFGHHPCGASGNPLPGARQHPSVGNIAIQARAASQQQQSHLVTFAAEMFAYQGVRRFVKHLCRRQRERQADQIAGSTACSQVTQFALKTVEVGCDQS